MAIDQRRLRRIAGLLRARLPEAGLDGLPDPRQRRGRRGKQIGVLMRVPLVAMLAGLKSFAEAEALTAEMSVPMRRCLGIARRVPDTTLRTTAAQMEPAALRDSIRSQVRAAHRRKALEPCGLPFGMAAIDGKSTAIGAWNPTYAQRQPHSSGLGASGIVRTLTASLVSSRVKVCLDASPIPPQTNEMGHFSTALKELVDAYRSIGLLKLISTDAGMCSEAHGKRIVEEHQLHYLFGLKGDQPTLYAEAQRLLGRRRAAEAETVDVVGKHTVTRRLFRTDELAGYLNWTHLQTVVRVHSEKRESETANLVEQEDRYYLSSLPAEELTAEQWLLLVRRHWGVENECHNTWDKIFREGEPRGEVGVEGEAANGRSSAPDDHPWFEGGEGEPRGRWVWRAKRRTGARAPRTRPRAPWS